MAKHYDVVIIGAGQAGGPLAGAFAKSGRSTALIERAHVGGTCVNEGCTPTKTMIASGRVAHLARRSEDYGVRAGEISIDMERVRQRKRAIVNDFRSGSERQLQEAGVTLLMGTARFTGPHTLDVALNDGSAAQLTADLVFINVGARPALPDLPGIDTVPVLTSTSVMELDAVPAHLVILGGGYIGLEFGQLFRRLGANVTIVQRGAHLLAREDDDIADAVADILREDGVNVLLNTDATAVAAGENGSIRLTVRTPDGERTITGSHLLAAAGRRPNSDTLDLDAAGIEQDARGNIVVNERLETSVAGVYALGDVNGGPAFTHISYDDYRIVKANVLEGGNRYTADRMVPYTVFTDPQLGRVGLTERQAREDGRAIKVATMPMTSVARALEVDETRGMLKAIIDADTDQMLGFAALGIEGGELMSVVQMAMMGKLPYTVLRDAVLAHPTLSESLNNLFASLDA